MEDLQICTIMDIMDKFGCETLEELKLFLDAYHTIDELEKALQELNDDNPSS